jgi:hypothetical protein
MAPLAKPAAAATKPKSSAAGASHPPYFEVTVRTSSVFLSVRWF